MDAESAVETGPNAEAGAENLKNRVLSALRWTAVARLTAQVITWAVTIVVIRVLDPADYGLMAMSEVVFGLLMMMSTAGLGSALIQAKDIDDSQVRRMFGVLLLVNGALFAALFLGAPLVGSYYREPRVVDLSRALALGFLLIPFITVPSALLSRDIDFKRKSLVELVGSVVSVLVILALAATGFGVWALVVGRILALLLQAIGLQLVRPFLKLPLFSFRAAKGLISFGGIYTVTTILWFLYSQADIVVAGRYFDSETLGYYAVAMHLASLVIARSMPLLNQVALPAYSRLQDDPAAVSYYLCKVVRAATIMAFPVFFGIALVAPEFVRLVLKPKYESAILPLVLLSLHMPLRLLSNLLPAVVYGLGRPRIEMGNAVFGLIVMPIAFLVGIRWGLTGLCVAWLAAFPLVMGFQVARTLPMLRLRLRDFLAQAGPATGAAAAMSVAVFGAKWLSGNALPAPAHLALLILVGAAVYFGYVVRFHREHLAEVGRMLRRSDG